MFSKLVSRPSPRAPSPRVTTPWDSYEAVTRNSYGPRAVSRGHARLCRIAREITTRLSTREVPTPRLRISTWGTPTHRGVDPSRLILNQSLFTLDSRIGVRPHPALGRCNEPLGVIANLHVGDSHAPRSRSPRLILNQSFLTLDS